MGDFIIFEDVLLDWDVCLHDVDEEGEDVGMLGNLDLEDIQEVEGEVGITILEDAVDQGEDQRVVLELSFF